MDRWGVDGIEGFADDATELRKGKQGRKTISNLSTIQQYKPDYNVTIEYSSIDKQLISYSVRNSLCLFTVHFFSYSWQAFSTVPSELTS